MTKLSGCFITNAERSKLLVIHRKGIWWEIIGGKIEDDETSAQAAEREAKEEADLVVNAVKLLYTHKFEHDGREWEQDVWLANVREGVPRPREAGHDDVDWKDIKELRLRDDKSPGLEYMVKFVVDEGMDFAYRL